MSNSITKLRAGLENRADGPVGPVPLEELLDRGHRQRRARMAAAAGVSAVVTAVVVLAAVGIVSHGTSAKQPVPTVPGPALSGPSAQQIGAGHWSRTAPVPASLASCGYTLMSAGSNVLLVGSDGPATCHDGAALYSPRTNQWRVLAPAPSRLRTAGGWQAAWTGSRAVVIDDWGNDAELDPVTDRWTMLSPPEVLKGALVVADPQRTVIMASGDSEALSFDGSQWTTLPRLPHVGDTTTVFLQGATVWAFVTNTGFSAPQTSHVYRLAGGRWLASAQPPLPVTVSEVQPFGDSELLAGGYCELGASCGIGIDPDPQLVRLGTTGSRTVKMTPFGRDMAAAIVAGRAIVGIQIGEGARGQVFGPEAQGAVAAYSPTTGKWYPAPRLKPLSRVYGDVWTPGGLLVLGIFGKPCTRCNDAPVGGAILRPAHTATSTGHASSYSGPEQFCGNGRIGTVTYKARQQTPRFTVHLAHLPTQQLLGLYWATGTVHEAQLLASFRTGPAGRARTSTVHTFRAAQHKGTGINIVTSADKTIASLTPCNRTPA
jgi:hypothetical protein